MNSPREAVIAGATGFIGAAFTERLSAEGCRIYCLVRRGISSTSLIETLPGVEIVELNSFDTEQFEKGLRGARPSLVCNFASYGVNPRARGPLEMLEGNIVLLTNLLTTSAKWPLRLFIHSGSCSEYRVGGREGQLIDEDFPLATAGLYGTVKAASSIFGKALAGQLNIPFAVLRLFHVYGPGEAPYRLIPYLIQSLRYNRAVDLTLGEQVRDLVFITDVVDAFLCAAQNSELGGEIFNVCGRRPVSIRVVAETVADIMQKPRGLLRFGALPYRSDEEMWMAGDNRKFVALSGWKPKVDLRRGIEMTVAAMTEKNPLNCIL